MNIENNLKLGIHAIKEYRRELEETKKIQMPQVGGGRAVQDSPEVKKQKEMLRVAELISVEYNRQQVYSLQQLAIRNQMIGMTEDEKRIQEAINQVTTETSRKIDEITKKREDAAGRGAEAKVLAAYNEQIDKVYELEEIFITMARNVETASIQSQRTFEFGWNKAFAQYAEDAYNYGRMAEETFKSITGNMFSALDNFVETGKFKFSDFAQSVIKDLIKIQLRMQMMQLFSSVIGGIGGLFNLGVRGMNQASPDFIGPRAASGGFIDGPTLIGENGPEIFIPQRSGTVIPNQQMSSLGGGQPQIVYNGPYIENVSAIDAKSFEDRLLQSHNAIWAANQYANKSLQVGRSRT